MRTNETTTETMVTVFDETGDLFPCGDTASRDIGDADSAKWELSHALEFQRNWGDVVILLPSGEMLANQ